MRGGIRTRRLSPRNDPALRRFFAIRDRVEHAMDEGSRQAEASEVPEEKATSPEASTPAQQLVKLTVNLGMEVYTTLKDLAHKRGTTMTECVRQAISTEQWVQETQEKGEKILVRDRQGQFFEIVFR